MQITHDQQYHSIDQSGIVILIAFELKLTLLT
jgi:hypothetical protein